MTQGEHNGYLYEMIMNRAYGIGAGNDDGKGPHMSELRNLYWFESPDKQGHVAHLKETKVREHLRARIRKGLDKVARWKLSEEERSLVEQGVRSIEHAHTADEFYAIAQLVHEATKSFLPQSH